MGLLKRGTSGLSKVLTNALVLRLSHGSVQWSEHVIGCLRSHVSVEGFIQLLVLGAQKNLRICCTHPYRGMTPQQQEEISDDFQLWSPAIQRTFPPFKERSRQNVLSGTRYVVCSTHSEVGEPQLKCADISNTRAAYAC